MTMAVLTAEEFVRRALDIADHYKTLYVMGCFGAPMNAANKARYCQNDPYNRQGARTKMILAASEDTFGFDCAGLIKAILWGWSGDKSKVYGGAVYKSNGMADIGANTMIAQAKKAKASQWEELAPGDLLWSKDHIGIYVGGGLAAECTPAWKNCVQITAVGNLDGIPGGYPVRKWSKHGKNPWVDYGADVLAKGSRVRLRPAARTYNGKALAPWVYTVSFEVLQLTGDRAVIGLGGAVTAAVRAEDLILER